MSPQIKMLSDAFAVIFGMSVLSLLVTVACWMGL